MRIGFLGGTFDPVHYGHLQLAKAALDQLNLDHVYFVLSPLSPFKKAKKITAVSERLDMLRLAIDRHDEFKIGEWELKRRGPSYTVTTLADYKKDHPKHQLFLIVGSDNLSRFNEWKDHDKILKLSTLVVGRRPGMPLEISNVDGQMMFLKGVFPLISSTEIRTMFSKGQEPSGLPLSVKRYVRKNHLYGS